jgi:hypothetical protein
LVFWSFPRSTTNKKGIKQNTPLPPLSLFPFGFMPPKNTMHFTKTDVKAKAKAIAKKFTVESSCELPPPLT